MDKNRIFRGKKKDTGKWEYAAYFKHQVAIRSPLSARETEYKQLIIFDGFADWELPVPMKYTEVLEETVGQYIGGNDKNNKMIFEGDILERKYNDGTYVERCVVTCETYQYGYRNHFDTKEKNSTKDFLV